MLMVIIWKDIILHFLLVFHLLLACFVLENHFDITCQGTFRYENIVYLFYYEKFKDFLNILMITTGTLLNNYSTNMSAHMPE